jgi:uncharacterized membrane protein YqjE
MGDKEKQLGSANSDTGDESLPALIARLGDDMVTLLDTKLSLLKIEIKEDLRAYLRNSVFLGVGGVIVVIGFALLNIAIALAIASLFEHTQLSPPARYALGFLLIALLYLIIGAVIIVKAKGRLAKQNLGPERSLEEFERDKRWLKREL